MVREVYMNKTILILLLSLGLCGCVNEPEKISGSEFQAMFRSGDITTVVHAEYVCEQDERVYLRESKMSVMDEKVSVNRYFYTDKSELDPAFYETLTPRTDCSQFRKELLIKEQKSSPAPSTPETQ